MYFRLVTLVWTETELLTVAPLPNETRPEARWT
jgi:hypothetical protein